MNRGYRGAYALFKVRMALLFQYRAAAVAGLTTQLFWGLVKAIVLRAFYAQSSSAEPLSLDQAISFIWLGQAFLQLLPWRVDKEIEEQVRSGHVAYELIRPVDLYQLCFSRSLANFLPQVVMRALPIFLLGTLFFGLMTPISWSAGLLFVLSIVFGALVSASISTLILCSLFWTIAGEGVVRLVPGLVVLLTGLAIPLPLFPNWLQPFLSWQPFRAILDIPFRLYTGVIPASEGAPYLAFQLLWLVAIVAIGRFMMGRAIRRVVIQGG